MGGPRGHNRTFPLAAAFCAFLTTTAAAIVRELTTPPAPLHSPSLPAVYGFRKNTGKLVECHRCSSCIVRSLMYAGFSDSESHECGDLRRFECNRCGSCIVRSLMYAGDSVAKALSALHFSAFQGRKVNFSRYPPWGTERLYQSQVVLRGEKRR